MILRETIIITMIVVPIAVVAWIITVTIAEAKRFYEDHVEICSFTDNCFIVDIDDFFTEKQTKLLVKSFISVMKIDNMTEADKLECYLNGSLKHNIYCF